jgi:hypothetical protein
VALVRTKVQEECIASIIRMKRISNPVILSTLMMEAFFIATTMKTSNLIL